MNDFLRQKRQFLSESKSYVLFAQRPWSHKDSETLVRKKIVIIPLAMQMKEPLH